MSLQNTPLQPLTPARLLHVIAKHALATALTPHVSACHCEPVRTLVWQSVSPQRNLTSLCYFGQIRNAFRIRPKYCVSLCATARSTDCHVASLLAMTCSNLPRGPIIPGHCRCTAGKSPLHPQTRFCLLHVIANRCMGPRHPLRGEEPQGSVALLWPLAGAGHGGLWGDDMADFGATRRGNPRPLPRVSIAETSLQT